jgi:hypothetical protein
MWLVIVAVVVWAFFRLLDVIGLSHTQALGYLLVAWFILHTQTHD